ARRCEYAPGTIFGFVADHVSSEKGAPDPREYPGNMHIVGFIHTPDGALRGEIGEIVQQLDIMPTLLGLTGNREPYFAFGRDVLNEPDRPRWSVSYDGGFRALTDGGVLFVPDGETAPEPGAEPLDAFRALIQQYYTRVERKNYTTDD
ncbi:MAG: LTA synthase family protein, partial [Alistipes sp.]|nr:LTA synthase family protein [Alistipes sp.]